MKLEVYSILNSGINIKIQFKTHFNHLYRFQKAKTKIIVAAYSLGWKCSTIYKVLTNRVTIKVNGQSNETGLMVIYVRRTL